MLVFCQAVGNQSSLKKGRLPARASLHRLDRTLRSKLREVGGFLDAFRLHEPRLEEAKGDANLIPLVVAPPMTGKIE